jgi:transketolase
MMALVRASAAHVGPVFIRAGRPKVPIIYPAGQSFKIGKGIQVVKGTTVTLIAHGLMVAEAVRASYLLSEQGISARVIDLHTIKPLDRDIIELAATETGAILVCEEHLAQTGLGVRVAQVVTETHPCLMDFVGIEDVYAESGTPDALLEKYGLTAANVAARAKRLVARKKQ